jgi:hypothetical protein
LEKGKNMFIEHDIVRDIDTTSGGLKALETLVMVTIAKEYTMLGSKFMFLGIVWPKIRPTRTTKRAKERGVGWLVMESIKRCIIVNDF